MFDFEVSDINLFLNIESKYGIDEIVPGGRLRVGLIVFNITCDIFEFPYAHNT